MNEKKTYIASIVVRSTTTLRHGALAVEARSEDEAFGIVTRCMDKLYPKREFNIGRYVVVQPLVIVTPEDVLLTRIV